MLEPICLTAPGGGFERTFKKWLTYWEGQPVTNRETRGNAFLRGRLEFPTKREASLFLTLLGSDGPA